MTAQRSAPEYATVIQARPPKRRRRPTERSVPSRSVIAAPPRLHAVGAFKSPSLQPRFVISGLPLDPTPRPHSALLRAMVDSTGNALYRVVASFAL